MADKVKIKIGQTLTPSTPIVENGQLLFDKLGYCAWDNDGKRINLKSKTTDALATPRSITLWGGASGGVLFDGSTDVSMNVTVANDSHTHSIYLPLAGGEMTGKIWNAGNAMEIKSSNKGDEIDRRFIIYSKNHPSWGDLKHAISFWANDSGSSKKYALYGEHNKPTSEDIGAFPITGGTLTGWELGFQNRIVRICSVSASVGTLQFDVFSTPGTDGARDKRALYFMSAAKQPDLKQTLKLETVIGGVKTYYNIYGEHNKPTATDIGAFPKTGGALNGDIIFPQIATWPTPAGETYPITSKGLSWSGSSDNAKIFYEVQASDKGMIVLLSGDDSNAGVEFRNSSTLKKATITNGIITADQVYGAVWNDYAEFRNQKDEIKPGYCVASTDNGKVYKISSHLQACDGIVSDTFGFAIGETEEYKTPIAVAGRVLAYCEGDQNSYHSGDTVGASENGKVIKMTREEIKEYPDRIVGIVSEIPKYKTWGTGNVKVDGRIWIKIK